MGGGVSSLPAEVSLAKAGAGRRQVAARVGGEVRGSQDLQGRGGEVLGDRGQGRDLRGALRKAAANRSGVAEALDFSAIVAEKRGQHLPGTREWVFEAVSLADRC